jgi:hypothetical protein
LLLGVGGLLLLSLALILPAAGPVWDRLPLANIIAFPWRLLGPALLWSALLGGAALALVPARLRTAALAVLLVLVPLSVAPYLFPRDFTPVGDVELAGLARYELTGGARATASANEYLPAWVADPDPPATLATAIAAGEDPDRLDHQMLPPGSRVEAVNAGPPAYTYRLALPQGARVRFRQFYFPGWRAWLDGAPAEIIPDSRHGLIEVDVLAGEHTLRLAFGGTPPRVAGGLLALGGALAVIAATGLGRGASTARAREREGAGWKAALVAGATILALTGIKALFIEPHTEWFRVSSPVEAPAGMQHPLHARFANGLELLGYDLPRGDVRQGDELRVRLYWRAQQPQQAASHPFLHLDAVTGETTWVNETRLNAGNKPSTSWPLGYYVVDDYRLAVGSDAPPVVASLRAGLLDEDGQIIPLLDGSEVAALAPVRITERKPLTARGLPGSEQTYRLGPGIELVGHSAAIEGDPPALFVTLYWRAAKPVAEDYTVFLHARDAAGRMLAQGDGPPVGGWYPSSSWLPGQIIADEHRLPLPAGTDPSEIQVMTGLYRLSDGSRLPVTDAKGVAVEGDQIPLSLTPK